MRTTRFPGSGVAVAQLVLLVVLGGCSNLTSPPTDSRDAGRDLSSDGRAVGGPDTDIVGGADGSPASLDGQAVDRVVSPGLDGQGSGPETNNPGETGGAGGGAGNGGVGGAGGSGGEIVDAYLASNDDGGQLGDVPQLADSTPETDAGLVSADAPTTSDGSLVSADTLPRPDTRSDAVAAILTVSAGADTTVCSGFSSSLGGAARGGTPPYVYLWSANPSCTDCIASPDAAQTAVSPAATTTFTLTVTDSLGATASDSVVVTVPSPSVDAGPESVTIDPGASVQIGTADLAGYSYVWTCERPTCSLSSTSAAQPTVKPSLSTKYTITATSPEGCIVTDSTTVWVNLPVSITPTEGSTYPRAGSLFVQFGAAVAPATLSKDTITLRETVAGGAVDFDYTYDTPSRILTISPKGPKYNTTTGAYTLTLVGGADGIKSNDSVRPQRLAENVVVNYTISGAADTTRPTIESRNPAASAYNVPTNAGVSMVWSETLDPTTVGASTVTVSTGMATTPVAGSVSYDPLTNTVTFVPNAAFTALTSYTVRVAGVQDVSGNSNTTATWSFTTGSAADTTVPTVTLVVPAVGATKVSVASDITVTFSEAVQAASAVGAVQVSSGGTPVPGSVEYDSTTRQAVFTPSALLAGQTEYTVSVSGAQDVAGNTMTTAFTSTFTTASVLFSDTFEYGTSKWTLTSSWGLTTSVSDSPTHSLTDSPAGNYGSSNTSATIAGSIDVTGRSSVALSYWLTGTMATYDYFRVEYSTGGGWTTAANLTGDLGNGIRSHNIPLGSASTQLQIRFRVIPSAYAFTREDGAYIDNVLIQAN